MQELIDKLGQLSDDFHAKLDALKAEYLDDPDAVRVMTKDGKICYSIDIEKIKHHKK